MDGPVPGRGRDALAAREAAHAPGRGGRRRRRRSAARGRGAPGHARRGRRGRGAGAGAGARAPPAGPQRRQPGRVARGVAALLQRAASRAELVDGVALAAVVAQPVAWQSAGQSRAAAIATRARCRRGPGASPGARSGAPPLVPRPLDGGGAGSRGRRADASVAASVLARALGRVRFTGARSRCGGAGTRGRRADAPLAAPVLARALGRVCFTGARARGTVDPPILAGPRAGHSRGGVVRIAAAATLAARTRSGARSRGGIVSIAGAGTGAAPLVQRPFWWTQRLAGC